MSKELETTFYRFLSEVKSFLSKLMEEPIKADVSQYLKDRNFNKTKTINVLIKKGILERHEKIKDSTNSDETKAKYTVKYKVKRKDFENKMHKIFISYFEKNLPEKKEINECDCGGAMCGGGDVAGATNAESSGQFIGPLGGVIRRGTKKVTPNNILGKDLKAESKKPRKIYISEAQYKMLTEEGEGGATTIASVADTSDGQLGPVRPGCMTFKKANGQDDDSAFERKPGFSVRRLK